MTPRTTLSAAAALAGAALLAACGGGDDEAETRGEGLQVSNGWCRATPASATTAACYMNVTNNTGGDERLTGGATSVAGALQLHQVISDGNIMRMQPVEALTIRAGGTAELKPGGFHVMLTELQAPLVAGGSVPVVLRFERAGEQTFVLPVRVDAPTASG